MEFNENKEDPLKWIDEEFTRSIRELLAKRRRDPASWNLLPFPVDYKALSDDDVQESE